jgi:NDP-mannose synthase
VVELKAVIQAGGRGTRLAPYSTVLPKALMPLGEGTVIDGILEQFSDTGVKTVFITVSKFGPLIRSYCGDGSRWGLDIEYVTEE